MKFSVMLYRYDIETNLSELHIGECVVDLKFVPSCKMEIGKFEVTHVEFINESYFDVSINNSYCEDSNDYSRDAKNNFSSIEEMKDMVRRDFPFGNKMTFKKMGEHV